jgi:hypothetical protein
MKSPAHPLIWTHRAWPREGLSAAARYEAERDAAAVEMESEAMVCRRTASDSLTTPLRIVGILAFCQALVFVVLFLFLCARAGAATEGKSTSDLELNPSAYLPQTARDPFGSETPKGTDGAAVVARFAGPEALKLEGILYDKAKPSALVNDQLVELNKTAKVHTAQGEVEVKALEITHELVVLEVGGQKVELRLGGNERNPMAK